MYVYLKFNNTRFLFKTMILTIILLTSLIRDELQEKKL